MKLRHNKENPLSFLVKEEAFEGEISCSLEWEGEVDWLSVGLSPEVSEVIDSPQILERLTSGDKFSVKVQRELILHCDRSKFYTETSSARLLIKAMMTLLLPSMYNLRLLI